jgi:hypothetical protein
MNQLPPVTTERKYTHRYQRVGKKICSWWINCVDGLVIFPFHPKQDLFQTAIAFYRSHWTRTAVCAFYVTASYQPPETVSVAYQTVCAFSSGKGKEKGKIDQASDAVAHIQAMRAKMMLA